MPSPSKRPHWDMYNEEMSRRDSGHALWEPSPPSSFKRIQIGDVGYIRTGCFHPLFSAGCPLGERELGTDVPRNFKLLHIGETVERAPLAPGCLCTEGVRATQVGPAPPSSPASTSSPPIPPPALEPASRISFQLMEGRGAALVTKYPTYREDICRAGTFEKYVKEHYTSWVAFARETGHGDVNPILITGVDRTRDFAMLCYSSNHGDLRCEFTRSAPSVTTGWGTWQTTGLVYTNHGPQLHRPPSNTQAMELPRTGNSRTERVSDEDEYDQCVFVRYFTVRKRLGIPRVLKAAAGPHDLGKRGRDGEGSQLQVHGWSSNTSVNSESDIVVHDPTTDGGRDDFDVIADYVFGNSDAVYVLLHHCDITLLREPGANRDLSVQLFEKQPPITVDSNGVGTIGRQTEFPPSSLLDPVVETLPPTPVSYSARAHRRSTTKKALLVGISYRDIAEGLRSGEEWDSIPTSIPNVKKFEQFIRDGWEYTDIIVMTDEVEVEERLRPTEANLKREMTNLCRGVKPGDSRLFYFTGHSDQLPCKPGTEEDGFDEVLVALNGKMIRDYTLHEWLVKPLPRGSSLTTIFDCDNSGTMLDLPHYSCNSVFRPWVNKGVRRSNPLRNYNVRKDGMDTFVGSQRPSRSSMGSGDRFASISQVIQPMDGRQPSAPSSGESTGKHLGARTASPERLFECDGWCHKRMQPEEALSHPDVISISSSGDGQISWDASTRNGGSLSMTILLIDILKTNPHLTYSQLMTKLNHAVYSSITRKMHSSVQQQRRNLRELVGSRKDTEPEGEMDNFHDLQLGSLAPLDMDRIFVR